MDQNKASTGTNFRLNLSKGVVILGRRQIFLFVTPCKPSQISDSYFLYSDHTCCCMKMQQECMIATLKVQTSNAAKYGYLQWTWPPWLLPWQLNSKWRLINPLHTAKLHLLERGWEAVPIAMVLTYDRVTELWTVLFPSHVMQVQSSDMFPCIVMLRVLCVTGIQSVWKNSVHSLKHTKFSEYLHDRNGAHGSLCQGRP